MTVRRGIWATAGVFLLFACGASEEPAIPAVGAADVGGEQQQVEDTVTQEGPATELMREVFSYRGSGRDPFLSLLQSGDVRPMAEDLRVAAILFDPRYPAASVATLRDTVANERYSVRAGDVLGRMRVAEILPGEVVLVITEFGTERQVVLRQTRTQERTP